MCFTRQKCVEYVVQIQLSLYLAVVMLGDLQIFSSDSFGTFFRKWWNRYVVQLLCMATVFFFFILHKILF